MFYSFCYFFCILLQETLDVTGNGKGEHNNTDEKSTDIGENEIDNDDVDILTNPVNRLSIENSENIENSNEDDTEINVVQN